MTENSYISFVERNTRKSKKKFIFKNKFEHLPDIRLLM